jgi:hypothetical protein
MPGRELDPRRIPTAKRHKQAVGLISALAQIFRAGGSWLRSGPVAVSRPPSGAPGRGSGRLSAGVPLPGGGAQCWQGPRGCWSGRWGRPCRRCRAVVISSAQCAWRASRRWTCRPWLAMLPATENSRSHRRLGSHRRASWSVRASICVHAVSSTARATIATQILLWAKPGRGSLVSSVASATHAPSRGVRSSS